MLLSNIPVNGLADGNKEGRMKKVVLGNAKQANESPQRGWIVGHMQEGLGHTNSFEVKVWHYDEPFEYGQKVFGGTELIIIYGGVLKFEFKDGSKFELIMKGESHDYCVIPPGVKKRVIVVEAPAFGDTIRWPSTPNLNQVIQI